MRLFSAPILGFGMFCMILAMDAKCDYRDVAGASLLDGLWFAAAISAADQGDAQLQGQIDDLSGQVEDLSGRTQPGPAGLACWDLNGNGQPDAEEDINADGVWDARDCQGIAGQDGSDGQNGTNGASGANCWDTIGDYNADGQCDSQDCLDWVVAHIDVSPGPAGDNCWDTIGDYNEDGVANGDDCLDWVADHTQVDGTGDSSIIARGYVDSFGYLHGGQNILSTNLIQTERFDVAYEVVVDLTSLDADLQELTPNDFPVLITVYAIAADPWAWSWNIAALVAHYQYDGGTSLDREAGTLTLRVHILNAQSGEHVGANFSIAVLKP